jgi:hypothetical protein
MSLEALAERTWKTQRVLLWPLVGFGAAVLIGGLVSRFPLLTGLGTALALGGGFGVWRLKVKRAEFQALLADPQRVAQVVPIVQSVHGVVTHFPVVVVADDGKTYRIATWARSVGEALAPSSSASRTREASTATPSSRPTTASARASSWSA